MNGKSFNQRIRSKNPKDVFKILVGELMVFPRSILQLSKHVKLLLHIKPKEEQIEQTDELKVTRRT